MGGTFAPPHKAHIAIAKACLNHLELDKVLFMPNGQPPHKQGEKVVSAEHRLNMTRLGIEDYKEFEICDIEVKAEGLSYSADTLDRLHNLYKDCELFFIIGGDSLCEIENWYQPERILKSTNIAVVSREGADIKKQAQYLTERYGARIFIVPMENYDISSTMVRDSLKKGLDISEYVDGKVLEYIKKHNVFGSEK